VKDYSINTLSHQTVRFLEAHGDNPFALWVSFPDPHEPWEVPQQYADMFPQERIELPPFRAGEFAEGAAPNATTCCTKFWDCGRIDLKTSTDSRPHTMAWSDS
jgi:hypothetical protein